MSEYALAAYVWSLVAGAGLMLPLVAAGVRSVAATARSATRLRAACLSA